MASENGHNNAPDSWDQDDQEDSASGLSKGLNANAPAFVPGKNPYATEFVPTFGSKTNQGDLFVKYLFWWNKINLSETKLSLCD